MSNEWVPLGLVYVFNGKLSRVERVALLLHVTPVFDVPLPLVSVSQGSVRKSLNNAYFVYFTPQNDRTTQSGVCTYPDHSESVKKAEWET